MYDILFKIFSEEGRILNFFVGYKKASSKK